MASLCVFVSLCVSSFLSFFSASFDRGENGEKEERVEIDRGVE